MRILCLHLEELLQWWPPFFDDDDDEGRAVGTGGSTTGSDASRLALREADHFDMVTPKRIHPPTTAITELARPRVVNELKWRTYQLLVICSRMCAGTSASPPPPKRTRLNFIFLGTESRNNGYLEESFKEKREANQKTLR